jgi:hypothetical protein
MTYCIYDHRNTLNATVFDVDRQIKLKMISTIDTENSLVYQYPEPLEVKDEKLVLHILKYRSIYPIFGGAPVPQMFLCFGFKEQICQI